MHFVQRYHFFVGPTFTNPIDIKTHFSIAIEEIFCTREFSILTIVK
jgi:hypothetical protein